MTGRGPVLRQLCAAEPLLAGLRAPATARAPWAATVLNAAAAGRRPRPRPVAVVVDGPGPVRGSATPPAALAALTLRAAGPRVTATLLPASAGPVPPGTPPARLPARDDAAATALAAGVLALLDSLWRPWTLRLTGLPLGDPTLRALGRLRPDGAFANARSTRLVDDLDAAGPVLRSRDPRLLDRWLPELLAREPARQSREHLRAVARLHAALGQLELAVVADGDRLAAALLTLLDGPERRPWWGFSDRGGLSTEMGAPLVSFTLRGGLLPARVSRRTGPR
ncbi:hypothetical protein GCU56_05040 [Geodermatophilus sabuli]|uniref:BioF2-like acetyltransferase domain-containing protein n=1 Tax=Geodermatophilus sabuli TaxID=1564158 RepID=A0A7K3VX65_9ACTN|nr:hypothetical protein [Geodermatophilus sabuli]